MAHDCAGQTALSRPTHSPSNGLSGQCHTSHGISEAARKKRAMRSGKLCRDDRSVSDLHVGAPLYSRAMVLTLTR
jgi:hypothetical protein